MNRYLSEMFIHWLLLIIPNHIYKNIKKKSNQKNLDWEQRNFIVRIIRNFSDYSCNNEKATNDFLNEITLCTTIYKTTQTIELDYRCWFIIQKTICICFRNVLIVFLLVIIIVTRIVISFYVWHWKLTKIKRKWRTRWLKKTTLD